MIEIKNKKIAEYLKQKDVLVNQGIAISKLIDAKQIKIEKLNKKEREVTNLVNPPELIEHGNKLRDEINEKIKELETIGKRIEEMKIDAIPDKMKKEHYALRDEKEKLERDRNKIALKIQKIKDRVIPLIRKEVVPLLAEYEDIEKAVVKDDKIVIETFNHLEDWKKNFKKNVV